MATKLARKTRRKSVSPTRRALAEMRALGYVADIVEKRLPIPGKFVTKDLYGCIDILGLRAGCPLLGIQVTSRSNTNSRMTKSKLMAAVFVSTGNRFEIWGFGVTRTKGNKRIVAMEINGEWREVGGT